MCLFRFQAGGRKRRSNLAVVLCVQLVVIYFVTDACLLLLDLVFQYQAKRLAGNNVSEMTYAVSGGT